MKNKEEIIGEGEITKPVNQEITETPPVEIPAAPTASNETDLPQEEIPGEAGAVSIMDEAIALAKKYNPDAPMNTPEEVLAAVLPFLKSMDALHEWVNESVEIEPAAGDMLIDVKNGYTWERAIHRNFDMDELGSPEGSDDAELVKADKAGRVKKFQDGVKATKDRNQLLSDNETLSSENLIAVVEELGLDDAKATIIVKIMGEILVDAKDNVISKENWRRVTKGLIHADVVKEKDAEIEKAFEDGEVAGKNKKIQKRRAKPEESDGLPNLSAGGGDDKPVPKNKFMPIKKEFRV